MKPLRNRREYILAAALFVVLAGCGRRDRTTPDIQVELDDQKTLSLRVILRSRAETPVTFYKYLLPWGNKNSLILEAVTEDDRFLTRYSPSDDLGLEQVTLSPKQWVSGDIHLPEYFYGLDTAIKKSDVRLFWAYKAPPELKIGPQSSGWVVIPQQK